MPTFIPNKAGTAVKEIDLLDLFEAEEGTINQYYGRVGQGKTYAATKDVLDDLANGQVIYANWHLNFEGHDDRYSLKYASRNFFFFRKRYYRFPKENFHFIEIDDQFMDKFEKLTDCKVYLDEGHVIFDSYEMAKMSLRKRKSILHTRHFNRTINIISQRPTAVHVSARGNVNIFYRCTKIWTWPVMLFRRQEFQDMTGETVDETADPISTRFYMGRKRVFEAYNSKYLRGGIPRSQKVYVEAWDLSFTERFWLLCSVIQRVLPLKRKHTPARESASPRGLNGANGVKESSGVPTTDDRTGELPF